MNGRKKLLMLWLLLLSVSIYGQSYTFRGLTMSEGLSDLLVNAFYKDAQGFMWIGTDNCLERFDGVTIKHYPFSGSDINKKRVSSILETKDKNLWTGNGLGLWKLNKKTDQLELFSSGLINCGVHSLIQDSHNVLYVGSEKGVFIYNNGSFNQIIPDNNILSSGNHILGMAIDKTRTLWMATPLGLYSYNTQTRKIKQFRFNDSPNLNSFSKITIIGSTLYLGTANAGLVRFDIPTSRFSRSMEVGSNIISDLSSDGKEMIYVATDGNGVHFLSHSQQKVVRSIQYNPQDKAGIRSNSVYSLLVDRDGIIWIGFYQAGFDYSLYQNNLFRVYSFPPLFNSSNLPVRSFVIDDKEKLIGTREGLYYISEDKKLVKSYNKSSLRSNLILSLRRYNNEYYIGTYGGGVSVLNPQTLSIHDFDKEDVFQKGHIFHFEEDSNGNLWIASSQGVHCYNKLTKEIKTYTSTNSQLLDGNVYYIFFDSTKKGWIATDNGLCIFDPVSQSIKSNIFPQGFFNKEKIRYIYQDSHNNIFFCPDKGDVFKSDLSMRNFQCLKMKHKLLGNAFMSVIEDNAGKYWLSRDNGIISMNRDESILQSFNFTDGIPDPIFHVAACYKDAKGKLWFGNSKGLLSVDPAMVASTKRNPYSIVLTDILVNGQSLDSDMQEEIRAEKDISLSRDQNNLTFRFSSLTYSDPSSMIYEYKLEGYDEDWQTITGKNEVSYYDLPVGSYTFHVRLQGDEKSEETISVMISPFLLVIFWIAVVATVIALALWGRNYLRKRLIKKEEETLSSESSELEETQVQSTSDEELDSTEKESSKQERIKQDEEKYKFAKLSNEECKHIYNNLTKYMKKDKPYINPNLKISDLAHAIKCTSHSLSYVFNQYLNQNYYDFVNEYRITEFKELANDPKYSRYTLTALSEKCGFSSRASFFRSFKKLTGITPNEYIQQMESSK